MKLLRRLVNYLASPALLLWLLPALMLLIAVGTVAQKYVGLYVAERTYFSSFVFWVYDVLPLPGGYTLMGVLALSLLLKFLLKSRWTRARAGINLAHFGVVLLFVGGLVSSLMAEDGSMIIDEGNTSHVTYDFHQREIVLLSDDKVVAALNPAALQPGVKVMLPGLPVQVEVLAACRNCSITRRSGEAGDELRSMARGMQLGPTALDKNDEANTGGLTFRISGAGDGQDGTYILFENGPTTKLQVGGKAYELAYGKRQRPLPFGVELKDFVRTNYPGTDTAKAYHSDVVIHDGALSWPVRIEMNKPLRYRGYTFYQSSFFEADGREATVLAVSRDAGQFIPYLGTLIMGLGLLLHLLVRRAGGEP